MANEVGSIPYKEAYARAAQLYTPTRFEFRLDTFPQGLSVVPRNRFSRDFQFNIESVFFPSRNISSEPIKIAGPVDEIPYEATYSGDLDISIRVSEDFREKLFFESWMDLIINQRTQNLSYPNSYRCQASISALNRNDEQLYQVTLTDVWPKSVQRVTVGQGLFNSTANMQLQLAFRRFFVTDIEDIMMPYQGYDRNPFISDKLKQNRRINGEGLPPTSQQAQAAIEAVKGTLKENVGAIRDALSPQAIKNAFAFQNRTSEFNAGSGALPYFGNPD